MAERSKDYELNDSVSLREQELPSNASKTESQRSIGFCWVASVARCDFDAKQGVGKN